MPVPHPTTGLENPTGIARRVDEAANLLIFELAVGMKVFRSTAWVLGALLLIVSLDTVPDPPAVNPHTVCVDLDSLGPQHLDLDTAIAGSNLNLRFLDPSHDRGPHHPSDSILLTGRATDPSPPPAV